MSPPGEAARRGDILLAQCGDGIKAHRVVKVGSELSEVRTQGDASEQADAGAGRRVLGKVVSVEREGRRVELRGRARVMVQMANRLMFRVRAAARRGVKGLVIF